jgi:peptidoglycan/xylan/chitin deacetylase (PgdA/CDA1 family)
LGPSFNGKSLVRSALIKTAAILRVDELALRLRYWLARAGPTPPSMLVVEMHGTPQRDQVQFRKQLEWAARHFTLVDLPAFALLWQKYRDEPGAPKSGKPPLLFTFDDGRLNNYTVAAPALEAFGARGVFFVIPQFVQCDPQAARDYYYSRIDTRQLPQTLPEEETRSMTPQNIADLSRRGHAIGNHTYSHVNLGTLPENQLHHEIVESAEMIRSWTGKPVDAFAWTFSWDSITPTAWKLVQKHHRFCFAPCPGFVDCQGDRENLIWRTEVEVSYPPAEFRFMYAGLANSLWVGRRRRLRFFLSGRAS